MDKEDQLSFDFETNQPVSEKETEKQTEENSPFFEEYTQETTFHLPTVEEKEGESSEGNLVTENIEPEVIEEDLDETQPCEADEELMSEKADFAPPENVDYSSTEIEIPTDFETKTAKELLPQQPEVDLNNFGDTQPVEIDPSQLPGKEEFAPPKNVDYGNSEEAPAAPVAAEPVKEFKATKKIEKNPLFKPHNMKRAILGWLLTQKPSGVGVHVPTRVSKYCADVAAFWSSPAKKRLLQPSKTAIVEIRRTREQCWPDCSRKEELLPLLIEQKELKNSLETEIRQKEPELKDTDNLFPEYEFWRYSESKNRKYRHCLKQIESIEHALYKGSRFEQIRRAHVADFLYLAVPEGTVDPKELADGWGLVNIKNDLTAIIIKEAETWNCPIPNRLHLAQNIAASSRDALFFSFGVRSGKGGNALFSPIPRRRRKK